MAQNILSKATGAGSNGAETLLLEKVQDVLLDTASLLHDMMASKEMMTSGRVRQIAARTLSNEIGRLLTDIQAAGIARPMAGRIVHRETDPDDGAYTDLNK